MTSTSIPQIAALALILIFVSSCGTSDPQQFAVVDSNTGATMEPPNSSTDSEGDDSNNSGQPDNPEAPPSQNIVSSLESYLWTIVDAKDDSGQSAQPITRLISEGKPAQLGFDAPDLVGVRVADCGRPGGHYLYSSETLRIDTTRPVPDTSQSCGVNDEVIQQVVALFLPGTSWTIKNATPPILTLVGGDGSIYIFMGTQP